MPVSSFGVAPMARPFSILAALARLVSFAVLARPVLAQPAPAGPNRCDLAEVYADSAEWDADARARVYPATPAPYFALFPRMNGIMDTIESILAQRG